MGLEIVTLTPSAPVATDGTMDFAYPAGLVLSRVAQGNEVLSIDAHGPSVLTVGADKFSVSYDADSATVTYLGDTTIPAGTEVSLQINTYDSRRITDSTTGTPDSSEPVVLAAVTNPTLSWNGSTDPTAQQATDINAALTALKNAIASLAQEVNRINGVVDAIAAEDEA